MVTSLNLKMNCVIRCAVGKWQGKMEINVVRIGGISCEFTFAAF